METTEELRQRVIAFSDANKEFYTDVDGFVYWWPQWTNGHLSSIHLRWIADELDRRNKEWESTIDRYFEYEK